VNRVVYDVTSKPPGMHRMGVKAYGEDQQSDLLSPVSDLNLVRHLLADLHDDLPGKISSFRQLTDLSAALGSHGTMMPGGETTFAAWTEPEQVSSTATM
jgi:hypothetical protein